MLAHKNLKKAKKRQAKYTNKNRKLIDFEIGDNVYYRAHVRPSKLSEKWKPYYIIVEKTSPVNYVIQNTIDGSLIRAHVEHLRHANVEQDWNIPNINNPGRLRNRYVINPATSDDTSSNDDTIPFAQANVRHERSASSSEDDLPLFELKQRLAAQAVPSSDMESDKSDNPDSDKSAMDIDAIPVKRKIIMHKRKSSNNLDKVKYLAIKAIQELAALK